MDTDQLAQLIEQKHGILVQLKDLAVRQADLVAEGDMTRLLSLLAAKQSFLGHLQHVEHRLDPFREDEPDKRQWRSEDLREHVRRMASENESLLQDLMRIEQECESRLGQRRDVAATRLQGVHDSSLARKAYLQGDVAASSRLDLSSES